MPNSRFALHGLAPSLIHALCAIFASNSRFMRLFQAPLRLDTCLDSPFFASLSIHGLHFTVYAPSNVILAAVWRRASGSALRTPRFVGVSFPRSALQRHVACSGPGI